MLHQQSRILVTGGAGFIGSHIVDKLLSDGFEVTAIDNLSTGRLENLADHQGKKDFHFIKGDIRSLDLVKSKLQDVDAVFHEAALVGATCSIENPVVTNEVNVTGTLNLLKACVDSNVKRFIYASSAAVYGKTETLPHHEDLTPQPISPYGVSKLSAENYVKVYYEVYGLQTVCLRYFNVYGPRQTHGPYSGVITIFINRLLGNQPPIIYGDGKQTRDFINIQDVVNTNMLGLTRKSAVGEVFNIATGVTTTVNRVASILQKIIGKTRLKPLYTDPRMGDIRHSYADISKARKVLGYNPKVSLENGLAKLVKWHTLKNRKRDYAHNKN
jgi:nucleoside-diphosphate-sugar epimerase